MYKYYILSSMYLLNIAYNYLTDTTIDIWILLVTWNIKNSINLYITKNHFYLLVIKHTI